MNVEEVAMQILEAGAKSVSLAVYDQRAWNRFKALEEPTLTADLHRSFIDQLTRLLITGGVDVEIAEFDVDAYDRWLGDRPNTPESRAEFIGSGEGRRFSLKLHHESAAPNSNTDVRWAIYKVKSKPLATRQELGRERVARRLSVREAANLVGVSERTWRRWEGGTELPAVSALLALTKCGWFNL